MLKPDFERTATGWVWSDRLTAPWWRLRSWITLRRIDRMLGVTGTEQERRRQRRRILASLELDHPDWRERG